MAIIDILQEYGSKWIIVETDSQLKVVLCSRGASLYSLKYKSKRLNLVPKDKEFFLNSPQYFGKTLGRVAGRIPCNLKVNDSPLNLDETINGFCLHGGDMNSLSFQEFDTSVKNEDGRISVSFKIFSRSGNCKFPGNLTARVTYVFYDNRNDFEILFFASSDADTPVSLSNHIYWDLNNDNDVSNQVFYMSSNGYGVDDGKSQLVLGINPILPCLDFRTPTKLGEKLDYIEDNLPTHTIDHLFTFPSIKTDVPQATLENDSFKIKLFTDFPAMNIYVDNSLTKVKFKNGEDFLGKRRAIALEPQINLVDRDVLILKANEQFEHFIRYEIEEK